MLWRQKLSLTVLALFVVALSGCGHSEEEWQAKLKENQELQNQLNAEKAAHQKAEGRARRSDAAQVDQLKGAAQESGRRPLEPQRDLAEQARRSRSCARTRAARADP